MEKTNNLTFPTIWVDADACPQPVRDILIRAALRRGVNTVFVANSPLSLPAAPKISQQLVPPGADKADDLIVEKAGIGDLAVTGDIPLAERLVKQGIIVIDTHGEEVTPGTVGERLAMRNLLTSLRSAGVTTRGPRELSQTDIRNFANALDRFLAKNKGKARIPPTPGSEGPVN